MKIGILSDIHADQGALLRALDILEQQQVDKLLCLGDIVEKGPDGDEVVATLQALYVPTVQGNHDLAASLTHAYHHPAPPSGAQPIQGTQLSDKTRDVLRQLPPTLRYLWEGQRIVLTHNGESLTGEALHRRSAPKRIKRMMARADADIILIGHTHIPAIAHHKGTWLLNPGAVCRSRSRDSFTCGVLTLPGPHFQVWDLEDNNPTPPAHLWPLPKQLSFA